ncbi:MAG: glycosyltransferase family 2 protein [Akkermansiaceae bacterium]|nr:glycosyltransferase family 2 protein [Akkermansiaceae bacterium]NNM29073.1 glycosyltransferase family 2 protein [Akkermansiaceae bacterium]
MDLVISIVSWNTRDLLRKCLESLAAHCDENMRIAVFDNASSDGTPEMIRREFPAVALVETGKNLGFGRAHNLVADHFSDSAVLFLNPDTELVENAPARMLDVLARRPEVAAVSCRMIDGDGRVQPLGMQMLTSPWSEFLSAFLVSQRSMRWVKGLLPFHDPSVSGPVRKLYGGCLMVRREALDEVGWFDERFFMYGEDVDLCRRLEARGWKLYFLSSTKVVHLCGGASERAPGRFAVLMGCESIAKLMRKYYGALGHAVYVVTILGRAVVRLLIAAVVRLLRAVSGRPPNEELTNSIHKHLAMLRWALRLESPRIPQ